MFFLTAPLGLTICILMADRMQKPARPRPPHTARHMAPHMARHMVRAGALATALAAVLALALPALPPAHAQSRSERPAQGPAQAVGGLEIIDAAGVDPAAYKWQRRLVVIFADSPLDPVFLEQMDLLTERPQDLVERGVLVITDTVPEARSPLRQMLRPHGFSLVLIDKDGQVKLRKPRPWDVREISRAIDKTELRQEELRRMRERPSLIR